MSEKLELDTPLSIGDIDFRIQSINKGGYATILAYKDARVDINRLNAVCGVYGWQRQHTRDNHNCIVSLWDKDNAQWVAKEDTGTESNTEQQKGLASDSFKRACFNWGIGIELYDYPAISVQLNNDEWEMKEWQGKQKPKATWNLKLKEWVWYSEFDNGKLTTLAAKDEKGKMRFKYQVKSPAFRFKKGEKDDVMERVLNALTAGDGATIRSALSEYDSPESQMAFWALFKSGERSAMKKLIED
jgi:hypothetical protein